ncbi:exodeoxyribonuclease VII small subunit [Candidatus Dojkabacteria bacterium]|uniref:Exodeoxyribonuclease VII small subunit n=1 Tax=Candidatus Dojkabacteria bacterium TaxID=2099670 RepID=A0A955L691_9BACT|nr:exodeoxyribonuclease VII small subunit [Candidatus Dojkabacteria bacterium]
MSEKKDNINASIKKLEELISHFEEERTELNLEDDIAKYEEAMKIVSSVRKELAGYEMKINEIKVKYEEEQEEMNF